MTTEEPTLREIEEMEYRRANPIHRIDEPVFKLDWLPNPDNIDKYGRERTKRRR